MESETQNRFRIRLKKNVFLHLYLCFKIKFEQYEKK
jgi:hypothetical protein